jgi:osmoprotectant transport system substrate-binding protein
MRKFILLLISILMALSILGCSSPFGKDTNTVIIGGKNFTEQDILVYLMKGVIEKNTNLKVETKAYLGGTNVVAQAIERGDLDIYAEYTGTALVNILGEEYTPPSSPEIVYEKVKDIYADKKQIIWLKPFGFNNTYTLAMRTSQADELSIQSMSDLAKQSSNLKLGATHEFLERVDGYSNVKAVYDMKFDLPAGMDPGLTYAACRDGNVDVIDAFSTDGRIIAFNLKVLEDDKQVFPPFYAAPLIRADTLKLHPEIADALNLLAGKINSEEMSKLNAKVDLDGKSPNVVANEWLADNGFL